MKSLRFKLTASFLFITVITLSMIGIFANVILTKQFNEYVTNNINKKANAIVSTLESRYNAWGGEWEPSGIESIGMSALGDGLILRVSTLDGTILWDAMTHNSGMCAALLQKMAENMESQKLGFQGGYTEKTYQVVVHGSLVGTITIGYYGPYFYTDNDVRFINTLNELLILAAVIAGVLSFLLGTYMAKRLSDPISRVMKTAEEISEGNYYGRVKENSNTLEIVELADTINSLAKTLGKQETLRKRLTADVAHELRTPIANLQSHLEAMIDGIWEPNIQRLSSCHDETIRLSKMISDLEMLDRYNGEHVILKKECLDVSGLIQRSIKSFESEFKHKAINLKTNLQEQFIMGDRDKIMQVFVNILSNALKYTAEGGTIQIIATGDQNKVRISIKDNGIGISQEDLPYIFERFYRADKSRSRVTGGSGIGLAIAKSLAEAHGGSIEVISTRNVGSEFIVVLPK